MDEIVYFAKAIYHNQERKFGIKLDDRRRHMYIIGKTGMGKTVLLENMAIQDIQAGRGVGIVDPHGEFAERILDFIPKNRINDVIYFNPLTDDITKRLPPLRVLVDSAVYNSPSSQYEDLKAEFGRSITCPECGSQNVVNATFWRMFKSIENGKNERRQTEKKLSVSGVG